MGDAFNLTDLLKQGPAVALLSFILISILRGWIYPAWYVRRLEGEIEELKKLNDRAIGAAEKVTRRRPRREPDA